MDNFAMKPTGIMILSLLAVLAAIVSSSQLAALANPVATKEAECADRVVEYLARHKIPEPVQKLVEKSRKFYPDFTVLYGQDSIKLGYESTLVQYVKKRPSWDECAEVLKVIDVMGAQVPCYKEVEIKIKDVVRATENQAARDVVEADYVCQMAYL